MRSLGLAGRICVLFDEGEVLQPIRHKVIRRCIGATSSYDHPSDAVVRRSGHRSPIGEIADLAVDPSDA